MPNGVYDYRSVWTRVWIISFSLWIRSPGLGSMDVPHYIRLIGHLSGFMWGGGGSLWNVWKIALICGKSNTRINTANGTDEKVARILEI